MSDKRKNNMNSMKKKKSFNTVLEMEEKFKKEQHNDDEKKLMPLTDDIKITEELLVNNNDFEDIDNDDIDEILQLRKLHFFDFSLTSM